MRLLRPRQLFEGRPITKITQNLYIGNENGAKDRALLNKKGIVAIVNCSKEIPCFFKEYFKYKHVPLAGNQDDNILTYIDSIMTFITKEIENGSVFIHCNSGTSRSAAFLVAYLMKTYKLDVD